jgi:hypothetical protein
MADIEMLGIMIAVSAGSMGFVLSLLTWLSFRGTPFGRALSILIGFMIAFTVYHASLGIWDSFPLYVLAVETLTFMLVVVFMAEMIRLHYKHLQMPEIQEQSP